MLQHSDYLVGNQIGDNPFSITCLLCRNRFVTSEIEDSWPISRDVLLEVHQFAVADYKEIHDLADHYLTLDMESTITETYFQYCWACGWWRLLKNLSTAAECWQIWETFFGCTGSLKNMDLVDINEPLDEVRNFITRHYERRFSINPRLFEHLVADVFRSLGFYTLVTGYTHDGGIDLVLTNDNGKKIGVQIKRQKSKISTEQIRSFVGAMVVNNLHTGMLITTSSFTRGAEQIRETLTTTGYSIDFLDSKKFYDALNIAQVLDKSQKRMPFEPNIFSIPKIGFYNCDVPMNSL